MSFTFFLFVLHDAFDKILFMMRVFGDELGADIFYSERKK